MLSLFRFLHCEGGAIEEEEEEEKEEEEEEERGKRYSREGSPSQVRLAIAHPCSLWPLLFLRGNECCSGFHPSNEHTPPSIYFHTPLHPPLHSSIDKPTSSDFAQCKYVTRRA